MVTGTRQRHRRHSRCLPAPAGCRIALELRFGIVLGARPKFAEGREGDVAEDKKWLEGGRLFYCVVRFFQECILLMSRATLRIFAPIICIAYAFGFHSCPVQAGALFEAESVFDPTVESHGHVHASCIVECPNGDLRLVWYENGSPLKGPYFDKQKDKSDDVRVGGARKPHGGSTWEAPFVMADSFGVSDNNPCMVIDKTNRLWLIRPTLLGVPEWSWGSGLLRYQVSVDYSKPGRPTWQKEDIFIPHPEGLEEVLTRSFDRMEQQGGRDLTRLAAYRRTMESRLKEPLAARLGWMPRAHPLVRADGTLVVPLSNENFNIAAMAMTNDGGETWTLSKPVPEAGLTQPTLVEFPDGKMSAFFRNSDPRHRIKRSDSHDGGMTWSEVTLTSLPHLGSGIEALLLRNGHLAMIYNDKERNPRDQLAVSISTDGGSTWTWTRRLEDNPGSRFDYPSLIQSQDGTLHATYSDNLKTIKHVHFNEEWVQEMK